MIAAERNRLEERRLTVFEESVDVLSRLGRHAVAADEARRVLAENPLRESLWARLVLSLHGSGQRSEALAAYGEAREILAEELGLDPGPELRRAHMVVLGHDDPYGPVVPAQLPADVADFTGRAGPHAALTEVAGTRPGVVAVVSGMPGVGKSAFAVHWAHRMASRFPDGQLFMDLRGHHPGEALTAREVLGRFVRALGTPAEQVPAEEGELAAAYRSLLARRRLLVVLDNAADPEQVRPLLPGNPDCFVLVTSRSRLTGLALHQAVRAIDLDVLSEAEAVTMLAAIIGEARLHAEPDAAAELARLCGRLPLALRIAAAHLAGHPHRSLARFVEDLTERGRLGALRLGEHGRAAVTATFDLSYDALAPADRTAFRRLGLLSARGLTAGALAAMLGAGEAEARARLDSLAAASLIKAHRGPRGQERYRFHDLLFDYARHKADTEDGPEARAEAVGRLLDRYLAIARSADLLPLEEEGEALLAATRHAADLGLDFAWRVPARLAMFLERRQSLHTAVELHSLAARAADRTGVPGAAAGARNDLGAALVHLGRYGEALAVHREAREIYRRAGDPRGVAAALRSIGTVHWQTGRYVDARGELGEALRLQELTGDRAAMGRTLNLLGIVHRSLGRYDVAIAHYERALAVHRETGDVQGEGNVLNNLGVLYEEQGRHAEAFDLYVRALALRRASGSRKGEGRALNNIGLVETHLGEYDSAAAHLLEALAIHRHTGDRKGEGQVLNDLAGVHRGLGDHAEALACLEQALAIRRDIGDRRGAAETHRALATLHHTLATPSAARAHLREALKIYTDLGLPEAAQVQALLRTT